LTESVPQVNRTIIQLFTTVDNREAAESIAHELVERRLAGCVQIGGPVCSTYSWNNCIEQSMEFRLTVKTTKNKISELVEKLGLMHPYDTPEIIWSEVFASDSYFKWLSENLST
jgi:periplasmic divalent cation tolerance protein